jgi:hypothetical protein
MLLLGSPLLNALTVCYGNFKGKQTPSVIGYTSKPRSILVCLRRLLYPAAVVFSFHVPVPPWNMEVAASSAGVSNS